jgi:hypothetical protein
MLSVIPHRRRSSTPLGTVAHALPRLPSRNGHGHPRIVAAASAGAGLAVGTAAGAMIFSHRAPRTAGDQEQAPDDAQKE